MPPLDQIAVGTIPRKTWKISSRNIEGLFQIHDFSWTTKSVQTSGEKKCNLTVLGPGEHRFFYLKFKNLHRTETVFT